MRARTKAAKQALSPIYCYTAAVFRQTLHSTGHVCNKCAYPKKIKSIFTLSSRYAICKQSRNETSRETTRKEQKMVFFHGNRNYVFRNVFKLSRNISLLEEVEAKLRKREREHAGLNEYQVE